MHSHVVDDRKGDKRAAARQVGVSSTLTGRANEEVRIISLLDGRHLAYAEYGDPAGYPLVYCHRHGGSRLEAGFMHRPARQAGFRIIAVDRPGMGASDFNRSGDLHSFSADLLELANQLGLAQFGIVCNGGGAAFALAAAHAFPQRVSVLLGVSALPPVTTQASVCGRLLMTAMHFYTAARHVVCARNPECYIRRLKDSLGYADRRILGDPSVRLLLARDLCEASRQGVRAVAYDTALHYREWDFDATAIKVPLHFWLGGADNLIPRHHVEHFVSSCSAAQLHMLPARGHFLFIRAMDEVFASANKLLGRVRKPKLPPTTPAATPATAQARPKAMVSAL